jgi:hypothetical protein
MARKKTEAIETDQTNFPASTSGLCRCAGRRNPRNLARGGDNPVIGTQYRGA